MKRTLTATALLAGLVGSMALMAPAAQARVSVGVNFGYPVYAAPPPVVYAPPAYYQPPAYYAAPAYYPAPVAVAPGFWVTDQWGHRHWHHRR